jgi:hypothetical protein
MNGRGEPPEPDATSMETGKSGKPQRGPRCRSGHILVNSELAKCDFASSLANVSGCLKRISNERHENAKRSSVRFETPPVLVSKFSTSKLQYLF